MSDEVLTGADVPAPCTGALAYRELDDGRCLVLYPMTFGKARLCVGPVGSSFLDDFFCYANPELGLLALMKWDGHGDPPDGWHRHLASARRREVGAFGETLREWVAE